MKLILGDCIEQMRELESGSVDAIVTDPPYGIEFMGKKWDHDVPTVELWREALRVLKPGGHLLSFFGSRTYHRGVVNIEDAGFEVRDQIMWIYGSGFPKSLDVGKAIDKMDAAEVQLARRYQFTEWVRSHGITPKQINACLGASDMGRHYTDILPDGKQPAIMTREHLEACRHLFADVPSWVEDECDKRSVESENFKRREVVGTKTAGIANPEEGPRHTIGAGRAVEVDITSPATEAAKQWNGWGTALKPSHEDIVMARKPFKGTVAANVLEHGTGAINVDGCRVDPTGERLGGGGGKRAMFQKSDGWSRPWMSDPNHAKAHAEKVSANAEKASSKGRWPANVIHDGLTEEWSRYFYCAKASKAERGIDNRHPTVKPIALMRYLVRLVTPPGGVVLDPFMGSGSTGVAALREGFDFVGIECDEEYLQIARRRIRAERPRRRKFRRREV